jgi:hypothetical protein
MEKIAVKSGWEEFGSKPLWSNLGAIPTSAE